MAEGKDEVCLRGSASCLALLRATELGERAVARELINSSCCPAGSVSVVQAVWSVARLSGAVATKDTANAQAVACVADDTLTEAVRC